MLVNNRQIYYTIYNGVLVLPCVGNNGGVKIEMSDNKTVKCLNCGSSLNNNYYSSNFCSGHCKDAYIRHVQE